MREKLFYGVSDQVRLKRACLATETTKNIEISHRARLTSILSREGKTKELISLHRCAGWSVSLLFACNKFKFSHPMAQVCTILLL